MKRARRIIAALVAGATLAIAVAAHADDDRDAAELFDSGRQLFERGEYRAAAHRFMRAFRLAPHADTAFNAALSWQSAGEPTRAAETFDTALELGLEGEARVAAVEHLEQLRSRLALVHVRAPKGAELRVRGELRATPARVYLAPGRRELVVVLADGSERTRRLSVRAGQRRQVDFADAESSDSGESTRTAGVTTLLVAGGIGVLSFAAELEATRRRNDFNTGDRSDPEERNAVLTWQRWATVGWVATGVLGAVGAVLVLGSEDEGAVALSPGRVYLRRRF